MKINIHPPNQLNQTQKKLQYTIVLCIIIGKVFVRTEMVNSRTEETYKA